MRLEISTMLPQPAAEIWYGVLDPTVMARAARPLIRFRPVDGDWPEAWTGGEEYQAEILLFGFLPLGRQAIRPEIVAENREAGREYFELRDRGDSALISKWDHRITVEAAGPGRARYTDRLDVEAGLLTPLVWLFAQVFFRQRQVRWRQLVRRGEI